MIARQLVAFVLLVGSLLVVAAPVDHDETVGTQPEERTFLDVEKRFTEERNGGEAEAAQLDKRFYYNNYTRGPDDDENEEACGHRPAFVLTIEERESSANEAADA